MDDTHPAVLVWTYIERGDFIEAAELLTDDFTFSGPVADSLSGPEWLGMHRMINEALPDFSFNMTDWHLDSHNRVVGQAKLTGTHTGTLNLTPMGVPLLPASGTEIDVDPCEAYVTLRDGKIEAIEMIDDSSAGIRGMLSQLGAGNS